MKDNDKRSEIRTPLRAKVKVNHPQIGQVETHTRDISEGGAYIVSNGLEMPKVGELVEVQLQGIGMGEAPIVKMRIVRLDKSGIGLQFVNENDEH